MRTKRYVVRSAILSALVLGVVLPASALLTLVGPVDPAHGFPTTYEDASLALELCLDFQNPLCNFEPGAVPNPALPARVGASPATSNFPEEAFWWAAESELTTNGGGQALLIMALEAAFNPEVVANGNQISFGRLRIRVDNLVPGETYRVTHPFGVDIFTNVAGGPRGINFTEDVGCEVTPCNFTLALGSRIGSFLTWDTFPNDPALPDGADGLDAWVGDPAVPHAIRGGQNNFFQIEGRDVGGPGVNRIRTNLFSVVGKVAAPVVQEPDQPVDNLAVARAEFRVGGAEWRVEGTSSVTSGNVVTLHAGSTVAGPVIGTATVAADGRWRFQARNSAVVLPGTNRISVSSSAGGVLEGVAVRRLN